MKKLNAIIFAAVISAPVMANAASFQSLGKIGMGGAGVAITSDSFATYWNPAGLAFYDKSFSSKSTLGAGVNINSALAENTDKLSKLDFSKLNDMNVSGTSTTNAVKAAGEAVQFIGILNDINSRGGTLTISPTSALAFQYKNFGLGSFASSEMNVFVNKVDTVNIMPANNSTTLAQFATNIGATTGRPTPIFSNSQYTAILAAFSGNTAVVDTIEKQLAASNKAGISTDQLATSLISLGGSFGNPTSSIDNNQTELAVKGLMISEIPFAYGYKYDLKDYGQLAVGAAVKVMMGTTFGSIITIADAKGSNNILKKVDDTKTESTTLGVDMGVVWKKDLHSVGPFSAGLVAKNLNSPQFDNTASFAGKTKVEPQARAGVAIDPYKWLTVAADMDVTKNKTIDRNTENQNIGIGAEVHPVSFFALRSGLYSNIANSSSYPVGTLGFSIGPKWLRLDVDGSAAFKTVKFDNQLYPREFSFEFGLSTMF